MLRHTYWLLIQREGKRPAGVEEEQNRKTGKVKQRSRHGWRVRGNEVTAQTMEVTQSGAPERERRAR